MTSQQRGYGTVAVVVLTLATRYQTPLAAQSPALDTTPPSVTITSPAAGEHVGRNVTISAVASDAAGVAAVSFRVDGVIISTDTKAPYSARWNTRGVADGAYTLRAEARDKAGNTGTSAAVTVIVGTVSDTTAPAVTITSPANGAEVTGTVTVTAAASDTAGVTSVTFLVDGIAIGTDTSVPYSASWNSGAVAAGSHTLRAQARDAAGNVATSAAVTVTVSSSSRPAQAVFQPSADNAIVIKYVLDVFLNGSTPGVTPPAATRDLGKPAVVNGEMTADIASTTASLPAATYIATVTAVTATSSARSLPSPPFVIGASATLLTSVADPGGDMAMTTGARDLLWVTNSATHLVAAFDAATGDVLATIPVGLTPTGIAVSDRAGKVYVADEGSDTVSVISKATMTRSQIIPLPPPSGRRPHHLSASPDGRFIYVGERGGNVVDVIDTATDAISARFSTGWPGSKTLVVAPHPDGAVLYALNQGAAPSSGTLLALEVETGRWLWHLPIDGDPRHLLIASDGRTGIVTCEGTDAITAIDFERHVVIDDIDPGAGHRTASMQVVLDGRLVLITEDASGVVAVDARSRTVVRRYRFPGGGTPHGIVFDPE